MLKTAAFDHCQIPDLVAGWQSPIYSALNLQSVSGRGQKGVYAEKQVLTGGPWFIVRNVANFPLFLAKSVKRVSNRHLFSIAGRNLTLVTLSHYSEVISSKRWRFCYLAVKNDGIGDLRKCHFWAGLGDVARSFLRCFVKWPG